LTDGWQTRLTSSITPSVCYDMDSSSSSHRNGDVGELESRERDADDDMRGVVSRYRQFDAEGIRSRIEDCQTIVSCCPQRDTVRCSQSGMLESRNLYTSPSPSPSTDSSTAPPSASSTSTTGLSVPNELLRLTLSKPPWWGNVYDELLPAPVLRLDDDEQMDDESESRIQRPFAAG
jgi:hypothetical protein